MTDLKRGMLPGRNWDSRKRAFLYRNGAVSVEDINLATLLICHNYKKSHGKEAGEYKPGKFTGTELGHITQTGEQIFLFVIEGDPKEFHERRLLFHNGSIMVDPLEWSKTRTMLITALKYAQSEAERYEKKKSKMEDG